jgi:hypothetical protein
MPYKLNPNVPDFDLTDGPFAGRQYRAGEIYTEVPPAEKDKFEEVREESAPAETKYQKLSGKAVQPPGGVDSAEDK